MLNFENLDKIHFSGVGIYNIPQIQPTKQYPDGEFIPFNYAKTEKHPEDKIVHCFIDDYQFYRLWNRPDDYISRLSQFKAMLAPDFSTYTDMPRAMQIYADIQSLQKTLDRSILSNAWDDGISNNFVGR